MSPLTAALTRNWTLKLSAFGLALLLWIAVRVEVPAVQDITGIRVNIALADSRWALLNDPSPATVTVRFAGPSRELIRIAMERPTISVPLDAVNSGDTIVVLSAAWLSVQGRPGIDIENIEPSSVRILLEPIERRAYPPALRFEGSLADSLAFAGSPVAEPLEIRVTGPRSRLSAMDSIPLAPIDLSTISTSGVLSAQVDTTALAGLEVQPRDLRILLQIEERITGSVNAVPVRLPGTLGEEGNLLVRFSEATAILQGARSVVDGVDPSLLSFVLDTTGTPLPGPGEEAEFPLRLEGLPPFLSGGARPERVTVRNISEVEP